MPKLTLVEAVNLALAYELQADPNVVVLGEDVGVNGGVFRATLGLQERFGKVRVVDTPLSETLIAGMAIGMAAQGLKPVAEVQFSGFIYPCLDQILNHAARLRTRTRGRLSCPLVLRAPNGGGIHAPEHHSESVEALFAPIPGLRVVVPSSPARAYGLLLAAIRDPDPVIFLEPPRLYRLYRQEVVDDGAALPLDVCYLLREGTDITLVSWGALIQETMPSRRGPRPGRRRGRSDRCRDLETARHRDHPGIGRQDRALRHRAGSGAHLRGRRGDRCTTRRTGLVVLAGADRTGGRLRLHHAALPAGVPLPARYRAHLTSRAPELSVCLKPRVRGLVWKFQFLLTSDGERSCRAARVASRSQPWRLPRASRRFANALSRGEGDLLLSGCKEGANNFSYDARIKGRPTGAFTYYALKALKTLKPDATYADWHAAINPTHLPSVSYPQSPQIVGSAEARRYKIFT